VAHLGSMRPIGELSSENRWNLHLTVPKIMSHELAVLGVFVCCDLQRSTDIQLSPRRKTQLDETSVTDRNQSTMNSEVVMNDGSFPRSL
jgi:hypothetical protein